jgi:hypothetical protein
VCLKLVGRDGLSVNLTACQGGLKVAYRQVVAWLLKATESMKVGSRKTREERTRLRACLNFQILITRKSFNRENQSFSYGRLGKVVSMRLPVCYPLTFGRAWGKSRSRKFIKTPRTAY